MCTDISINSYCWVVSGGQEAIPYTNTEVNTNYLPTHFYYIDDRKKF